MLPFGLLLRLEELEKAQRDLVPVDVDDGMIFSDLVKQISRWSSVNSTLRKSCGFMGWDYELWLKDLVG